MRNISTNSTQATQATGRHRWLAAAAGLACAIAFATAAPVTVASASTSTSRVATSTGTTGVYDAGSQFSTKSNPHGAWSYLVNGSLLTTAVPNSVCGVKQFKDWWNGQQEPDSASVTANKTTSSHECTTYPITIPADTLNLDPESLPDVTVQWTASAAGKYAVVGSFTPDEACDPDHPVAILHNGSSVYSNTVTASSTDSFDTTVKVAKGDTVSFVVYTGTTWTCLGTGLKATLTKS
jgi:hypothetical protein